MGRRRLGEVLVAEGVITENQLLTALASQADQLPGPARRRLGSFIVELGMATEQQIASALAEVLGLPLADLSALPISPDVSRALPRAVAERYAVLLTHLTDGVLHVVAADPTNVIALDDVRLYTRAQTLAISIAPETIIRDHLRRVWSLEEDSSDFVTLFDDVAEEDDDLDTVRKTAETTPVVRLLNSILADAVRARASDVHIEPQAAEVRIRYRVDGLLRDVMTVPRGAAASLVSRMKILSGLDISERRRPQDGRTRLTVDNVQVDSRVSTLPTVHGEKVVVRLVARADAIPPLNRSGLEDSQLEALLSATVAPQGLVLITGPTGSGKTSTLYAALNTLRTPDRNIVTLEDPVEIQLPGINQVQVHEKSGMTFARGLRSILRQDPDVVLVGEIRDTETAELALQASLTGHLVLSTLHANDAPRAITRLVDIGVEPFLIASSLSLVVAQRLVRVPCSHCGASYVPSPRTLELLGLTASDLEGATLRRGRGCGECGHSGYRGRTGIFEVLPVTAALRAVLLRSPTEGAIMEAAQTARIMSMRGQGVAKALRGETTLEEVLRVTHVDAGDDTRCVTCARSLAHDMACCPWCTTPVERNHCVSCSRTLDPTWRVCPYCQTARDGITGPLVEPESAPRLPRVLVVDDDPSVLAFVAAALTGDAEVLPAATAEDALRLTSTEELDLVILDLGLPDLSGLELARLLRADVRTAVLPLLLLSGQDEQLLEGAANHAGADGWLRKPVDPAALASRVLALVAR